MGRKRHFKGNNRSEDKKRRREAAEAWANTRGDDKSKSNKAYSGTWVLENNRMQAFYRAQGIFENEEDYESFLNHLRQPLPACFRICSDYAFVRELQEQLHSFVGQKLMVEDREIEAVRSLQWYPQECAYKLGTDRRTIRKLDALSDLHQWLIRHTDNGNITRQEAVSMVPPLALNVAPGHKCLDMCAAPGSKTSQLLEVVNRSLAGTEELQGLVVANDSDTDRAYMLVHQCKRINSPLLVVTTHKGQLFPSITELATLPDTTTVIRPKNIPFFDRVLCDVPCSGDGTLRKNPSIWTKWNTAMGSTLHPLQIIIAKRGLQLLKPGGLLVYSTCSMSPFEDEAVVAELLRSSNGCLELVDARQFLPNFRCRAGLKKWVVFDDFFAIRKEARKRREAKVAARKPADIDQSTPHEEKADASTTLHADGVVPMEESESTKNAAESNTGGEAKQPAISDRSSSWNGSTEGGMIGEKYEDMDWSGVADEHIRRCLEMGMTLFKDCESVPQNINNKIRKTLFPPSAEENEWMHLERCLRCLPQDEDTGGFFVATLRKKEEGRSGEDQKYIGEEAELDIIEAAAAAAAATEDDGVDVEPSNEGEEGKDEVTEAEGDEKASGTMEISSSTTSKPDVAAIAYRKGMVDFHQFDPSAFEKLREFYGMTSALPPEAFFVREDFSLVGRQKNGGGGKVGNAKSVYYVPSSARQLMKGDREQRLKIVAAGVKVFEKKILRNGMIDYRMLQDGIQYLAPHITKRVVEVTIQDFCNLLGGGLVSYSTLAADTVEALNAMPTGALICKYQFKEEDMLSPPALTDNKEGSADHTFYAIGWKGFSRTLNVMCGKVEIDHMKHQLDALHVLRPKICAVRAPTEDAAAGESLKPAESTTAAEEAEGGDVSDSNTT